MERWACPKIRQLLRIHFKTNESATSALDMPAFQPDQDNPCKVFLSYAHKDTHFTPAGMTETLLTRVRTELDLVIGRLDLPRDALFFDEDRLKTEPTWEQPILEALKVCRVLIFLISPNSIPLDCYCVDKEVRYAVEHGIPIVPILFRHTEGWDTVRGVNIGCHYNKGGIPKADASEVANDNSTGTLLAIAN